MKGRPVLAAPPKLIRINPLPRGSACLACRKRRVRCDSAKPACAACVRNAKFLNEECKCAYEAPSEGKKRKPPITAYTLLPKDKARRARATERRKESVVGGAEPDAFHAPLDWEPENTHGCHRRALGTDAATPSLASADETPSPSSSTHPSDLQFPKLHADYPYSNYYPESMQLAPISPPSHPLASASFATAQATWPWKYPLAPYTDLAPIHSLYPGVRRWVEGVSTYQPAAPADLAYAPFLHDPQPPPVAPDLYWPGLEGNARRHEMNGEDPGWEDGAYLDWDGLTVCEGPQ